MFRYYQTGERTKWVPIPDEPNVREKALRLGAKKLTILAVSEEINDDTEKEELQYKGPWYADIDNKDDLNLAILSARQLVNKLRERGVPDRYINVLASGSKGIHVIVPETLFSSGRAKKMLPAIYMEMALSMHVLGMDFQVYSGGRGVTWRIPNVEREDGRYPVPVTVEELFALTADRYRELVTAPRDVRFEEPDKAIKVPGLESLYEEAKKRVSTKPKPVEPVPEDWLQKFQHTFPPCVEDLAGYKVKEGVNFNQAAMQLAAFVARAAVGEGDADSLVSRMATHGKSQTYNNPKARQDHLQGLVRYAQHRRSLLFACGATRAVLSTKPCEGCPLQQERHPDGHVNGDDATGLLQNLDGYYIEGEDHDRRISNFIIVPQSIYLERSITGKIDRRVATVAEIVQSEACQGEILLSEEAWNSKSALIKELSGIGNLMFLGTDADVQRLKFHVYREGQDMSEVIQVHESGMHIQEVGGKNVFVYVEPKESINSLHVRNTHILAGNVSCPPKISTYKLPNKEDDDVQRELLHLYRVNAPAVVAQILGWHAACHLKVHFMRRYQQFPLLNLWGNAGAGKTMTAMLFSTINGVDYTKDYSFISLPTVTTWALLNYCSSSTTAPRVLEEFNRSKMKMSQYNFCLEVMKAAFNGQAVPRGTLSKSRANGQSRSGAEVIEIPLHGPLAVLSEQAPSTPALMHRMVQVNMSKEQRAGCTEHFNQAFRHKQLLFGIAKLMVLNALNTTIDQVEEMMGHYTHLVPDELVERAKFSYEVVLTGLEFLQASLQSRGLDNAAGEITRLQEQLVLSLRETAAELILEKERSEIDTVIETLGHMAMLTAQGIDTWLVEGKNFMTLNGALYFEPQMAHLMYKRFSSRVGQPAVIENYRQFITLLRQEKYFETDKAIVEKMAGTRYLVKLDMAKMAEKGIDPKSFGA